MQFNNTALALLVAASTAAIAAPAAAQAPAAAAPAAAPERKYDISPKAGKAINELLTAVNGKDVANIPAKLAAAEAVAKSKDDHLVIAKLRLKAAADANDTAAMTAAVDALAATGAPATDTAPLYLALGQQYYKAKNYDAASTALMRAMALDPNNLDPMLVLSDVRAKQNRSAEGLELISKAIATKKATGQVPEDWYKVAVSRAYESKSPNTLALSRDWLTAYPSPTNWRDALVIYSQMSNLEDSGLIDIMRLQRTAKALKGGSDYFRLANTASARGFPGETKAVLEEAFAAGALDRTKVGIKELYAQATAKTAGDRASLAASGKAALAGSTAKAAMTTADAYYGYGDYVQAAELYRAALTKSGADKDQINLRLGMALVGSGDKAGAMAALGAVTGPKADIAKYWMLYASTKA